MNIRESKPVLSLFVLCILIVGCSTTGNVISEQDTVKIGAILHLSANDYAAVGQAMKEGIELAVSEQNSAGGINGKQVELVIEDDQYNMVLANNAAHKLLSVDKVDAAIISTYTEVMVAGPIFEQAQTPLVVLWDSSPMLEDLGEYIFATGSWTPAVGTRLADYAYDELGLRSISIITNQGEWSEAVASYFSKQFELRGGTIVFHEGVIDSTTDFRTVIAKASNKHPDAIFAPLAVNLDLFFRQIKESEFDGVVLTSDAMTLQTIQTAQGAAEEVYYTSLAIPATTQTKNFALKYKEHFGKKSDMLLYTGLGYDGAKSILEAMKSGSDGEAVKKGLYDLQNIEGAFGFITMNDKGSSPKYESIYQVQNNQEIVVKE